MFLVGLTGGIAAGKSTVAELWQSLGAEIIDADELAREIVQPGSIGLARITEAFGQAVLNADKSLNRSELAQIVFSDFAKRKLLEAITHPMIRELAEKRIAAAESEIVVYVIPLLVESESDLPFDFVVTVEAPLADQLERMTVNRGMTESEALARVNSQAAPAERANMADRILSSNQSLALLLKDSKVLFKELELLAKKKAQENVG